MNCKSNVTGIALLIDCRPAIVVNAAKPFSNPKSDALMMTARGVKTRPMAYELTGKIKLIQEPKTFDSGNVNFEYFSEAR